MRTLTLLSGLASLILAAGCQDYYATKLLTQDTNQGRVELAIAGTPTGEQLVQQKRISFHQVVDSPDRTPIDVWVCSAPSQPAKGAAIILHGMNSSKAAFPYRNAAVPLNRMGYDVVLIDLRAHRRSGGKYVTFGAKEKLDVKAVMDALVAGKHAAEPFYVFGANYGASVAIQYAAIDPRVKGVLAMRPIATSPPSPPGRCISSPPRSCCRRMLGRRSPGPPRWAVSTPPTPPRCWPPKS